jgi:hypothetical protein
MDRALARGLPALSLSGAFAGHAPASLTVNRLDGHPNGRANRLAAQALLAPLASSLDPDPE